MQFRVPQFIETEDKVIGPFSLRQFGYIAAAGVISFFLYLTVQTWLWFIATIIVGGGAAALAFFKVGGRPLPKLIRAGIVFYWRPQTYLWATGHTKEERVRNERFSLERIVSGLALKRAWKYLQTGSIVKEEVSGEPKPASEHKKERYQIFHRSTGEHRVAKRVDYT